MWVTGQGAPSGVGPGFTIQHGFGDESRSAKTGDDNSGGNMMCSGHSGNYGGEDWPRKKFHHVGGRAAKRGTPPGSQRSERFTGRRTEGGCRGARRVREAGPPVALRYGL